MSPLEQLLAARVDAEVAYDAARAEADLARARLRDAEATRDAAVEAHSEASSALREAIRLRRPLDEIERLGVALAGVRAVGRDADRAYSIAERAESEAHKARDAAHGRLQDAERNAYAAALYPWCVPGSRIAYRAEPHRHFTVARQHGAAVYVDMGDGTLDPVHVDDLMPAGGAS